MKNIFLYFLFWSAVLNAQITINVTNIPSNTPPNSIIYLAGSINGFNAGDSNYILQRNGIGNLQIVITEGIGIVKFKFTRGSWPTVEGNATGGFLPDRTFTFTGAPQTINLTIQSWEDLGSTANSTAAANVQILSNSFGIPQLSTTRRIWLYLPPDYDTSTKKYPVLYMQDAQNLFDNKTSFSGEWQVDETLNTLFNQGDYGAIVVGIDNGGGERLNEYSPWVNLQYGGGKGDEYMNFMANTLKPYIDANYRTRPEPSMNALIGSSMGAIISTYGACEYPNAFQKVGSFSPAYWFALSDLNNYITTTASGLQSQRMYFVAGSSESTTMVSNINTVRNNLLLKGLKSENAITKFDSYGTHSEGYWRGEFSAAYKWLFQTENLSNSKVVFSNAKIIQTSSGKLFVEGILMPAEFQIINVLGQVQQNLILKNGVYQLSKNLPKGVYVLRSTTNEIKPMKIYLN